MGNHAYAFRRLLFTSLILITLGAFSKSSSQVEIPIPDSLAMGAIGHRGHVSFIKSASFSKDRKLLATAEMSRMVCLWDLEKGKILRIIEMEGLIDKIEMSPDGSRFAISGFSSAQRMVYVFKIDPGEPIHRIRYDAEDMKFSPDGKSLIAVGYTNRIWNASTSKFINIDESIVSWDAETGQETGRYSRPGFSPVHLALSPEGSQLAIAARGSGIWSIPVSLKEEPRLLTSAKDFVSSVAFSPSGAEIAYCCLRDSACVIDADTGNRIAYLPDTTNSIYKAVFGPEDRTLITIRGFNWFEPEIVTIYNLETREVEQELSKKERSVIDIAADAHAVTTDKSRTIRLVDLKTGNVLVTIPGEPPAVGAADGFPLRLLTIGMVQRSAAPPEGVPALTNDPSQEYWQIDVEMENHGGDLLELTSPSEVQIVQGTFREEAGLGTLLMHNKGKEGFPLLHLAPKGGGTADKSLVISQNKNGVQQQLKTTLKMQPHERIGAGLVFVVPKKKKEKDYRLQLMIPSFRVKLPIPAETK